MLYFMELNVAWKKTIKLQTFSHCLRNKLQNAHKFSASLANDAFKLRLFFAAIFDDHNNKLGCSLRSNCLIRLFKCLAQLFCLELRRDRQRISIRMQSKKKKRRCLT